jgi:CBS domain-containing protein
VSSDNDRSSTAKDLSMRVKDVMAQPVVTVSPEASIFEAVRLMLQHKISGLPVVEHTGRLVGMVTEADFLRRNETDTVRRRPRWIEFIVGPGRLAEEYVHASGRRVNEVMTRQVRTIHEDVPLEEVVSIMERYRVKRVPVVRGYALVGIVTRADLVHALVTAAIRSKPGSTEDADVRERLLSHLREEKWAPAGSIDVDVVDGVVTLSGIVMDERQRAALLVAAENIPGVKKVEDRMSWLAFGTGLIGAPPVIVGPWQQDQEP